MVIGCTLWYVMDHYPQTKKILQRMTSLMQRGILFETNIIYLRDTCAEMFTIDQFVPLLCSPSSFGGSSSTSSRFCAWKDKKVVRGRQ